MEKLTGRIEHAHRSFNSSYYVSFLYISSNTWCIYRDILEVKFIIYELNLHLYCTVHLLTERIDYIRSMACM